MQEIYLGIMTGTSLDAVDAALVSFTADSCELQATHEHPFPADLQRRLRALIEQSENISLDELGSIDRQLGFLYAEAVQLLLEKSGTHRKEVLAIGCHGQTIRHQPNANPAFTMQIGDAATLANESGIISVTDFRSADIALGGQGAPLAPLFHHWLLGRSGHTSVVVNIGGIANVSIICPDQPVIGFDTGPGNTLLDHWHHTNRGEAFDKDGAWAATGIIDSELLDGMLADPYFAGPPPKSTGREYFNGQWLDKFIAGDAINSDAAGIQATLAELTAATIAAAVLKYAPRADTWLCGGGAFNADLCKRIGTRLPDSSIQSTAAIGLPPAWVEAAAFAWLARARINAEAVGMPSVTGAEKAAVLGAVHYPTRT